MNDTNDPILSTSFTFKCPFNMLHVTIISPKSLQYFRVVKTKHLKQSS